MDEQRRKQYRVGDGYTRLLNDNGEPGQSWREWSETPSPSLKECLDELAERLSRIGGFPQPGTWNPSPLTEFDVQIDDVSLQVVDDEKQRAYERSRADLTQKRRELRKRR